MSAQPQAPAGQQQQMQLLKVDDVPKLLSLNDDLKQKYKPIFQQLWSVIHSKPAGTQEHIAARTKLQEFSQRLIAQERTYRARAKQNAAQQSQAAGGEQSQSEASSQQNPQPKVELNQPTPTQQPLQNQSAMQQSSSQTQGQGPPPQGDQRPQVEPEIVKHVQNFTYWLPVNGPQPGSPEGEAKIKEMRNSYLLALNKQHKAKSRIAMLDNMVQQRQKSGQEIPPEIANNKAQMQKEYNAAKEFVDNFREKQKQNKMEHDQRRAQQQQQQNQNQNQNQQSQEQPAQAQFAQRQMSQPNIKAEPTVKVEPQLPQAPSVQQFGNMQGGPQQTQQQQAPPQHGGHPQAPPSMPQQQPMRQPVAPLQQHGQAPIQHPQFAQPGQPQPHQPPPRPQVNPHQANGMQNAQTNSPHPQSATSNPGRPGPIPLSHQDAVNAAQRSYSDSAGMRTGTPMQGQGNFHTPGSREREQMNNPKMPIPRNLNTSQPSPVPMGPARPTISGPTNGAPGPMGQPVIARMPPFQLEGDNDRVLSKRKLDELVRQVTGGSEEALTPEVEDAVLQMADDFVDTVISNACKLAKLRESPQLDIRDLQLILERNYNIRIPGYASDEVRTVRRLVPAPGWTQKMNAVQAAKVMGGKTDI